MFLLKLRVHFGKGGNDLAPRTNRSFSVVVVCHRIAEVDEYTVTEILGNVSFVASDHTTSCMVIGTYHVTQNFRV